MLVLSAESTLLAGTVYLLFGCIRGFTLILDLSHFLHERIEDSARNRNPTQPIDVMTGDPEAGRAYFFGAGTCSTCHSPTGDLAGVVRRIPVGAPPAARPVHGRGHPRRGDLPRHAQVRMLR